MEYEYEGENIRKVRLYNVMTGSSKKTKPIKELEEVYAKAKAFNEISDVIKKAEFYDRDTALDVIEIVEDLEDKQND
ncbi:hypothetical protein [Mammaliicoccus sciuri]|uniref:hypothetical protein n=1 Tax=Mammaliicoccus sciuri TaxID=1296 RepID=UPI003F57EAE5